MSVDLNHLKSKLDRKAVNLAVIGLGYVGLPLALALARHYTVTGFDVDTARIEELGQGIERNNEVAPQDIKASSCHLTSSADDLAPCDIYIVTVPTPLKSDNQPDLSVLEEASRTLAPHLTKGNIVVYESTVYPGVTEEVCGPILEEGSGLKTGESLWLGYSPERVNPGDTAHTVETITKVVAGQRSDVTDLLADLYGQMNGGNIFKAKDIKTAEASKVIENAQRDINVAFINEVTQVVNKLGLSIHDILEAAGTKWNFLPFTPGLVGGHCIGVDPYYLAHCAEDLGYDPEVILAGRRINDGMGAYFARTLMGHFSDQKPKKILILGVTFKENINDIRGTKVVDIVKTLQDAGHDVDVHDPHADPDSVQEHCSIALLQDLPSGADYNAVVLAVSHDEYKDITSDDVQKWMAPDGLIYDLKALWRGRKFGAGVTYLSV